jgi:hypothetical protein
MSCKLSYNFHPLIVAITGLILFATVPSQADDLFSDLNTLEHEVVEAILSSNGWVLADHPEEKLFGELVIIAEPVFPPDSRLGRPFNRFHITTQEEQIAREVLWEVGAPYEEDLVTETLRNLRRSVNFSVVAILPIESNEPGVVNILIVTRDTWSLRLSNEMDITDGVLNSLFVALTERNLAGRHKYISIRSYYAPSTVSIGPTYIDQRLFGSRFSLSEDLGLIWNHQTGEYEGNTHFFQFSLPLYSIDSKWGFQITESHNFSISRLFVGGSQRQCGYDPLNESWDCDTQSFDNASEVVNYEIERRSLGVRELVLRSFGREHKNTLSFGHGVSSGSYALTSEINDPIAALKFEEDYLPYSEFINYLYLGYNYHQSHFETLRNLNTYAFSENVRTGLSAQTDMLLSPTLIGSDNNFINAQLSLGYTVSERDFYLGTRGEISGRLDLDTGELFDRRIAAFLHTATPQWGPFRIHLAGRAVFRSNRLTQGLSVLGGSNGLRGFPSGYFLGNSDVLGHLEFRTLPLRIWTQFIGMVLFFDGGTVFDENMDNRGFISDVGLGIRWVIPEAQRIPIRFDYAFPISGEFGFFPGVFTLGFGQAL